MNRVHLVHGEREGGIVCFARAENSDPYALTSFVVDASGGPRWWPTWIDAWEELQAKGVEILSLAAFLGEPLRSAPPVYPTQTLQP